MGDTIDQRKELVTFMIKTFGIERIAYLVVTLLSFGGLATCIVFFVIAEVHKTTGMTKDDLACVGGMFGAGGIIGLTAARLLKMWTDCLKIIKGVK
jgi:hypothetical protein